MTKAPVSGAVKTRLARDIGTVRATAFYRTAMRQIIDRVAFDRRWTCWLAIAPDTAVTGTYWPAGIKRLRQGSGDLGKRMQRMFAVLPPGPVIIIGTDIPEISAPHIANAFAQLAGHDAILGPAGDGGYWLVGQRRMPRTLAMFSQVRWSSAHTLDDTLNNLHGRKIAMTQTLEDVDDQSSYGKLAGTGARLILAPASANS